MPAHKIWRALMMTAPTPATLELSEFHLYSGVTRVDGSATLTSNIAPNTGTLANLKDDSTATGAYWSSLGNTVVLTWTFSTAVDITGIVVGARTTSSRYPTALILQGGDTTTDATLSPEFRTFLPFGLAKFVSATKSAVTLPVSGNAAHRVKYGAFDYQTPGGIGRVPYDVKREILPSTTPKTYTPAWARVRLERDIDGKVIREQWNNPVTGTGAFEGVDENYTYTVTAIDPYGTFRAVIADRIVPEVPTP